MTSCCFWHQVFMWNEAHHRSRILSSFKIFSYILESGAIIALAHLNLHHLRILLSWWMLHTVKWVLLLHLCSLLHQVLSSKGHATLKLLLHLFKVHELAIILLLLWMHVIELANVGVLNLHVVLDWRSSLVIYFTVLHGFPAYEVARSAWCWERSAALTSVHVCEVSEIRRKVLLSHFEL